MPRPRKNVEAAAPVDTMPPPSGAAPARRRPGRPRKNPPSSPAVTAAHVKAHAPVRAFDPARILEDLATRLRDVRLEALPDLVLAVERATAPRGRVENTEEGLVLVAKKVMEMPIPGSKLDAVQRAIVMHSLALTGGNISAAARLLGVERKQLERKVNRYRRNLPGDEN